MTEANATAPAAPTFQRKKRLTKPALKFVVDKPMYVLIMGKIHEGEQRGKAQIDPSTGQAKKPPMVCDVVDLTTGEECSLIAAEIIKTELASSYPNDSYVGHGFEITKQKRKEGKRYDPYDISEIELPEHFQKIAEKVLPKSPEAAKPAEAPAPPASEPSARAGGRSR